MKIKSNIKKVTAVLSSLLLVLAPLSVATVANATVANQSVSAMDSFFSPQTITVNVGDTITWTNMGSMQHTVTADDGSFNSGTLNPGATFSHAFNTAGTFRYYCQFHGGAGGVGMSGTVTVVDQTGNNINTLTATVTTTNGGLLVVNQIIPIQTSGAADGTWTNGWKWLFDITAPTNQPNVTMKFGNWLSSNGGQIPVSYNMRFFSSQSATVSNENSALLITSPNVYSASMFLNTDLGGVAQGSRHFQITVEVKIPSGTPTGSYTTNFGINTQ